MDRSVINKKEKRKRKKRTCKIMDFAVPADHRVNLKESEKKYKYLDLAWELKKLWNIKVSFIPIVTGALSTVTEGLSKGLEDLKIWGRVDTIQTSTLLRLARIPRRVLETWGDLLSLKLQWKTNSQGVKKIILPFRQTTEKKNQRKQKVRQIFGPFERTKKVVDHEGDD